MKKKKQFHLHTSLSYTQQLKFDKQEKAFWIKYFNNPPEPKDIPKYVKHLSFRSCNITDEEIYFLTCRVECIDMLDLDDAYITKDTIKFLTKLKRIQELRLKGCTELSNDCVVHLKKLNGLHLLHLVGTNITLEALTGMDNFSNLKKLFISTDIKQDITAHMQRLKQELPLCKFYVNYTLYPN